MTNRLRRFSEKLSWAITFAILTMTTGSFTRNLEAQTCPAYPPEVDRQTTKQTLTFISDTGCTNDVTSIDSSCACGIVGSSSTVTFSSIATAAGRPIQSCDLLTWNFGDGITQTSTGTETVRHTYVVPSSWLESRDFTAKVIISNTLGGAKASATFRFSLPPCAPQAPAVTITQSFRGPKSGCTPNGGTCAVGEPIIFSIGDISASADPCDYWYVEWGDGTRPETFPVADPTAAIAPSHFFATTGKFDVKFWLQTSNAPPPPPTASTTVASVPPAASMSVTVTEHGTPPARRRAVRW